MKSPCAAAAGFALIPGAAEYVEQTANHQGSLALFQTAKQIKYLRNVLYFGVALTAIGATGEVIGTTKAVLYTTKVVGILGFGITSFAATKLYHLTLFFVTIYGH